MKWNFMGMKWYNIFAMIPLAIPVANLVRLFHGRVLSAVVFGLSAALLVFQIQCCILSYKSMKRTSAKLKKIQNGGFTLWELIVATVAISVVGSVLYVVVHFVQKFW